MKYLKLLRTRTFAFNVVVFILLSVAITILCFKIPPGVLCYKKWPFRIGKWENNGAIYQHLFKVKLWKSKMLELGDFFKSIMPKRHLKEYSTAYLSKYLVESCRAEISHWSIITWSYIFFLWNDFIRAATVVVIANILNLPYIIIQRYNRPRVARVAEKIECQASAQPEF